MKRFWLVLLSLGLIAAFSTSALAVDVQFSGSMYVAGVYLDRIGVLKDAGSADKSFNTAFFYQRLRVRTDFIVAPGVKVVTRFDAMERVWGGQRAVPGVDCDGGACAGGAMSAGTLAENQNIAFDWAYIEYASPIGVFQAGYMQDGPWGLVWGDTSYANPRITYYLPLGSWNIFATAVKLMDNSYNTNSPSALAVRQSDVDSDKYAAAFWYTWKGGMAGLLGGYWRNAATRSATEATSYLASYYALIPFATAQIGPVKVQAEVDYLFGKLRVYDSTAGADVKIENLTAWLDAMVTMGPVYFGGSIAYASGDDPNTTDKLEGLLSGGRDYNPCLLMFNYEDRGKWIGGISGASGTADGGAGIANAWFFQGKVGVKPVPALDIYATVTYATLDKKPLASVSIGSTYGWEIDVVGTYKLTNNLSYMLGGAYWFVGDYYKGASQVAVNNDYMLINKLTLTF